jgi:flagellar protein FlbD
MRNKGTIGTAADVSLRQTRMIQLTRLNNTPFMVNSDLIKFVEQSPDTVITLLNNEKILVRENTDLVLQRIVQFRRAVLAGVTAGSDCAAASRAQHAPDEPAER